MIVPKNTLIEIDLDTDDFKIHENFYFKFSDEVTKPKSHEEVGKTTFKLLEKGELINDYYLMYLFATSLSGGIDSSNYYISHVHRDYQI